MCLYKVSIIIPAYNVEKYLRQCLDSIVNQTLKDIEIICVNDGSTDRTLLILEEYAAIDHRIRIISKPNTGYGHSMNIGLKNASGEYIGVVESDDYAELDMFEKLYTKAKEYDLDLVRSHFYFYNSNNNTVKKSDFSWVRSDELFCPLDDYAPFFQQPSVWVNLYRKKWLFNNNIFFLETPGASYQDVSFSFKAYACAKKFMLLNEALLYYRVDNENSSINSQEKVFCVCTEYAEIDRFVKERALYEKLRYLIPRIKYGCYRWNFNRLKNPARYAFLKQISKECRKDFFTGNIKRRFFSVEKIIGLIVISFIPFILKHTKKL